jgi:hypothetical protein
LGADDEQDDAASATCGAAAAGFDAACDASDSEADTIDDNNVDSKCKVETAAGEGGDATATAGDSIAGAAADGVTTAAAAAVDDGTISTASEAASECEDEAVVVGIDEAGAAEAAAAA